MVAFVVVIVVIIVLVVAFGGSNSNQTSTKKKPGVLALDQSKLPHGWGSVMSSANHVILSNPTGVDLSGKRCSIDMGSVQVASAHQNATNITKAIKSVYDASVSRLKDNDYTITQLPDSQMTVLTSDGQQKLSAYELTAKGPHNNLAWSDAYSVTDKYNIHVHISCANQSDLDKAKQAVAAINLTQ